MLIIKTPEELKKHLNEHKDLIVKDNIRIEYQVSKGELRDVKCFNLYLENEGEIFDFHGENFHGWNFHGKNFHGENFHGWNFHGKNFHGRNFHGGNFHGENFHGWDFHGLDFYGFNFHGKNFHGENFHGKKISYYAFFTCAGDIHYEGEIEGRREPHHPPVSLTGVIVDKLKTN